MLSEVYRERVGSGFRLGLALLFAGAAPPMAQADEVWPRGNQVSILVPFSPGGIADVPGRILTDQLSRQTGATFLLTHRPGAGGTLGTTALAEAANDGSTLLIVSSGVTIAPALYPQVAPDPRDGLTPLSVLIDIPISIMVPAASEITSLEDLIERARANPGGLAYGSGGIGSGNHLAAEIFQELAGVEMFHVPYAGASAATTGMLTGETDLVFTSIFESAGQARSGMARILGVASTEALDRYPDVPVIADVVPGYQAANYFGLVGPQGLDPAIVEAIAAQLAQIAANPEAIAVADTAGLDLVLLPADELRARFELDVPRYGALIERLGITQ